MSANKDVVTLLSHNTRIALPCPMMRVGILILRARNPQSLGLGKVQEMEVVTEISS